MKTYKQRLHEKMQARIKELRQTFDTAARFGVCFTDLRAQYKEYSVLCNLAASNLTKTQRKKLAKQFRT